MAKQRDERGERGAFLGGVIEGMPLFAKELIAGGVAGGFAKSAVAPLERIKILFQTRQAEYRNLGLIGSFAKIAKTEGTLGFFRGNGASVARIVPYAALHYMAYEEYRRWIIDGIPGVGKGPILDLVAGSFAGGTAVLFTYPLDLVRTKLAYQVVGSQKLNKGLVGGEQFYKGIKDCFSKTYKEAGIKGLYRGVAPSLYGIFPYAGLKFYFYEKMKSHVRKERKNDIVIKLACGSVAGLLGQTFTYPLDVVRRQMQVQRLSASTSHEMKGTFVQSVATYFNHVMSAIGGNTAGPGDAVVNVYINHEKKFAFVEMRSVEEASNAMALDGIIFEGTQVKVRRPTDYNPSLAATLGPSQPNPNLNLAAVGLSPGSTGGLEGPDRIFVGGLPYYFTEAQIRELLESFGPLRGFNLVKDKETGNSKGYAFCVYADVSVTDIACTALNGIKMGDKTLTVRRASQGTLQPKPEQESILMHAQQQIALQRLMLQPGGPPTKVLCLTNVVSPDELKDDEDYEDILEDMRMECGKFGNLVNLVIPRPRADGEPAPGVGKVFLEYTDVEGSSRAQQGLNGRKFGGNQVVAVFYPENKFSEGNYEG